MPTETDILPPRYRGPQRVGRGGMGEIYRATDATLGRAVAVKVLAERYAEDDAVRERFTREALAAARLSGEPNIVTIFDVGDWNDRPFIVMEYLGGGSLEEKLRGGAQSAQQACEWLEDAARALDAAHGHGVVHRDVKPANLLLDRDDNVYVADFGIASAAGLDSMTMTGTVMGTAGYLSPEQAQGERATAASDRYALGIVAFELLTGTRPFEAESMTAEAAAHVHAAVPSVSERLSSLPRELDPVFERALAKDPAARYPTCAEFVADLRQALHEAAGMTRRLDPVSPPPPPPAYAPARSRGFPVVPALVALALIAAGILAAALLTRGGDAKPVARTFIRTIVKTAPGRTITQKATVTQPGPPLTTAPLTSSASASAGTNLSQGKRDSDAAFNLIRNGDYAGALPLAQKALAELRGTGDIYEGYANYNVGTSLIHLGRCSEGLPYLDASERIQGARKEIDNDRKLCRKGG
ncbi:MAG: eukaryotic-like serine/threonine-protein kinase [Gaiellaceae bacterium]|nr:eukaryotic-like serine/threonine-protein kinase [Gaiellaceae bacterium]